MAIRPQSQRLQQELAKQRLSPSQRRKERAEAARQELIPQMPIQTFDTSTSSGQIKSSRFEIEQAKKPLLSLKSQLFPKTRKRAFIPRKERAGLQAQAREVKSQLSQLETQEQKFETEVAQKSPELAKPKYKAIAFKEARDSTLSQANSIKERIANLNKQLSKEGITSVERNELRDRISIASEELKVYNSALSSDPNNLIKQFYAGGLEQKAVLQSQKIGASIEAQTQFTDFKATPEFQEAIDVLGLSPRVSKAQLKKALVEYEKGFKPIKEKDVPKFEGLIEPGKITAPKFKEFYSKELGVFVSASEPSGQATVTYTRSQTPEERARQEKLQGNIFTADISRLKKDIKDLNKAEIYLTEHAKVLNKLSDNLDKMNKSDAQGNWVGTQKELENYNNKIQTYSKIYNKYQINEQKYKLLPQKIQAGVGDLKRDYDIRGFNFGATPIYATTKAITRTAGAITGKGTEKFLKRLGYRGIKKEAKTIEFYEPRFGTLGTDPITGNKLPGFEKKQIELGRRTSFTPEDIGKGVGVTTEVGLDFGKYMIPIAGASLFAGEVGERLYQYKGNVLKFAKENPLEATITSLAIVPVVGGVGKRIVNRFISGKRLTPKTITLKNGEKVRIVDVKTPDGKDVRILLQEGKYSASEKIDVQQQLRIQSQSKGKQFFVSVSPQLIKTKKLPDGRYGFEVNIERGFYLGPPSGITSPGVPQAHLEYAELVGRGTRRINPLTYFIEKYILQKQITASGRSAIQVVEREFPKAPPWMKEVLSSGGKKLSPTAKKKVKSLAKEFDVVNKGKKFKVPKGDDWIEVTSDEFIKSVLRNKATTKQQIDSAKAIYQYNIKTQKGVLGGPEFTTLPFGPEFQIVEPFGKEFVKEASKRESILRKFKIERGKQYVKVDGSYLDIAYFKEARAIKKVDKKVDDMTNLLTGGGTNKKIKLKRQDRRKSQQLNIERVKVRGVNPLVFMTGAKFRKPTIERRERLPARKVEPQTRRVRERPRVDNLLIRRRLTRPPTRKRKPIFRPRPRPSKPSPPRLTPRVMPPRKIPPRKVTRVTPPRPRPPKPPRPKPTPYRIPGKIEKKYKIKKPKVPYKRKQVYVVLPTVYEQIITGGVKGRIAKKKVTGFEARRFLRRKPRGPLKKKLKEKQKEINPLDLLI